MNVSVVIPTYNRGKKVLQVLNALQGQSYRDFEVIVVVDGSPDNTAELLKSYRPNYQLVVIDQENKGRAGARNAGIQLAKGELLVFYDDDVIPAPDSVERHVNFHKTYPGASILAGNPAEYEEATKTDFQNYKAYLGHYWLSKYPEGASRMNFENVFLAAANCSVKARAFHVLGMFDDTTRDHEDYDLAYRALAKGLEVWFDHRNIAIHDDPITCRSYVRRLRQYALAREQDEKEKYPLDLRRRPYPKKINPLKKFVYWLFSSSAWIEIIDSSRLLNVLPRKIRYKIYELVTFSQSNVFVKK